FKESIDKLKSRVIDPSHVIVNIDKSMFDTVSNRDTQFKSLELDGTIYQTNFMTDFEVENLAFAIKSIEALTNKNNLKSQVSKSLESIQGIPGRLEYVVKNSTILSTESFKNLKNPLDVMVDYAHETGSMELLLKNMAEWKTNGYYDKLIHIVSCDGVGRDDWKKPVLGNLSQQFADFTYVTTDNYAKDDNPEAILDMIAKDFDSSLEGKTYTKVINRKDAMIQALRKSQTYESSRVIIVSTGVGTEQFLTQPDGLMRWDERLIWEMLFENYI
ncbi:MAG: glutamate ligase domain-containing protein, partial [Patescibacteria group bacterium]